MNEYILHVNVLQASKPRTNALPPPHTQNSAQSGNKLSDKVVSSLPAQGLQVCNNGWFFVARIQDCQPEGGLIGRRAILASRTPLPPAASATLAVRLQKGVAGPGWQTQLYPQAVLNRPAALLIKQISETVLFSSYRLIVPVSRGDCCAVNPQAGCALLCARARSVQGAGFR